MELLKKLPSSMDLKKKEILDLLLRSRAISSAVTS